MVTSRPPIDIRYIADALVWINHYLHVADVSPDRREQDRAVVMAGQTGCDALQRLRDDTDVWERLGVLHQELQQWRSLQVPIVADLFRALGDARAEPADTLISTANDLLQEAAGFPVQVRKNPITEAKEIVDELIRRTCDMASSARRKSALMGTARGTLKILGGVLLGVIATEADTGLREVAPHAVHLVKEFAERAGQALPSLSMGALVAGIRLARQDMSDVEGRGPVRATPRREREGRGPVPATPRREREGRGPVPAGPGHEIKGPDPGPYRDRERGSEL